MKSRSYRQPHFPKSTTTHNVAQWAFEGSRRHSEERRTVVESQGLGPSQDFWSSRYRRPSPSLEGPSLANRGWRHQDNRPADGWAVDRIGIRSDFHFILYYSELFSVFRFVSYVYFIWLLLSCFTVVVVFHAFSPCIVATILRLCFAALNSKYQIPCHVPVASLPSRIGMVTEAPINALLMCA